MVHTHHCIFAQATPPSLNPDSDYGLRVTMVCPCRFMDQTECPTLVGDAGTLGLYAWACSRGGWGWGKERGSREISVPSF